MKTVKLISPSSDDLSLSILSVAKMMAPVVPTYLAALAPEGFDFKLVDMLVGDEVDYDEPCDLVGITVRTPMADVAYRIADEFIQRGIPVALGGPHITAFPLEASQHATTVVIGEAENTWRGLLQDLKSGQLRQFYVAGRMTPAASRALSITTLRAQVLLTSPISGETFSLGNATGLTVFSPRAVAHSAAGSVLSSFSVVQLCDTGPSER